MIAPRKSSQYHRADKLLLMNGDVLFNQLCSLCLQHPGDGQILIDGGPADAHRHDLVIFTLCWRRAPEARIPFEQRCDLAAVRHCDNQFAAGKNR